MCVAFGMCVRARAWGRACVWVVWGVGIRNVSVVWGCIGVAYMAISLHHTPIHSLKISQSMFVACRIAGGEAEAIEDVSSWLERVLPGLHPNNSIDGHFKYTYRTHKRDTYEAMVKGKFSLLGAAGQVVDKNVRVACTFSSEAHAAVFYDAWVYKASGGAALPQRYTVHETPVRSMAIADKLIEHSCSPLALLLLELIVDYNPQRHVFLMTEWPQPWIEFMEEWAVYAADAYASRQISASLGNKARKAFIIAMSMGLEPIPPALQCIIDRVGLSDGGSKRHGSGRNARAVGKRSRSSLVDGAGGMLRLRLRLTFVVGAQGLMARLMQWVAMLQGFLLIRTWVACNIGWGLGGSF